MKFSKGLHGGCRVGTGRVCLLFSPDILCGLWQGTQPLSTSVSLEEKRIYVALDTSATRASFLCFLQYLYESHSLWKRFLAPLGSTQSPILNPNPSQEEIAPAIKPAPSSIHCESWAVTLDGGKVARKSGKCWTSIRSASKRLQTAPGLHWERNAEHSLLPDTAKRKKKLAKGNHTKQSTCSMNFWALAWESDHVAYRTIIRKGVSRLIIKELRAYQPWVADVLRAINGVKKSSGELWRNPAKTHAQTHLITKYVYMTSMSDSSVF